MGAFSHGGCTETIEQYARFGGWSRSPKEPMVFSGEPSRDASAYGASKDVLSESDWETLERIAPRPIWEQLAKIRQTFMGKSEAAPAPEERKPDPLGDGLKLALDVPTTRLPDGRSQMYYRLRHYGGVGVTSAREGGTERRKITLTAANLAPLLAIVTAQLGDKGTVAALPEENTLVITCDPAVQQSVLTLLAGIDVPPHQVEISARIFEVSHDFDFQVGAETLLRHLSSSSEQSAAGTFNPVDFLAAATASDFQGGVIKLLQIFEKAGVRLEATIRILADSGLVKVVAAPRMTVTVGRTAYMLAGQEIPIQSARYQGDQILTEKTTYKPIGVQLYITPQVVGPASVKLHVVTVVSAISGFTRMSTMDQQEAARAVVNPVLDSREAETFVTVDSESTLVIGGLRMIRTVTRERKMPGFGDLPLLEWFFKSHRSQNHLTDLYFFVTPRLIKTNRPKAAAGSVMLRRSVHLPPPAPAPQPPP
ncbi:MAG: hypothetical protein WBF17_22255, partial [Phycisphaerae bacterium]